MLDPITMIGLIALGFVVSMLVGLTSVGSGALMTPILYLDYSGIISHSVAIGTSTTQGSITKSIGSLHNWLRKSLYSTYAFTIAITGVPFAAIGAFFTKTATSFAAFQLFMAAILLIAAALVVFQANIYGKSKVKKDPKMDLVFRIKAATIGIYIGLIAGVTGISTGSLAIASILLFLDMQPHTAVDLAIFEGFVILLAATIVQISLGNVSLPITGLLALGGIPGIIAGSRLKRRLNTSVLTYLIAAVIIFESARIIVNYFFPRLFFII